MPYTNSSITGSSLLSAIESVLVSQALWTKSGGTFPYTYTNVNCVGQDRFMSFTINAITSTYIQFGATHTSGQVKYFYLWTGGGSLSASYPYFVSAGPNHFFLSVEGPDVSLGSGVTEDVTWGSSRGCFGMFALEPYFTTDTVKNDQIVAIGSATTAAKTSLDKVYVAKTRSGSYWAGAELMTIKPAVSNTVAVGAQITKRDTANILVPFWPYLVVEDGEGLRGRLKDVYYGGESWVDSGDTNAVQYPEGIFATIDGNVHITMYPFFLPNVSGQYSPFGVPVKNTAQTSAATNGGPSIAVRI